MRILNTLLTVVGVVAAIAIVIVNLSHKETDRVATVSSEPLQVHIESGDLTKQHQADGSTVDVTTPVTVNPATIALEDRTAGLIVSTCFEQKEGYVIEPSIRDKQIGPAIIRELDPLANIGDNWVNLYPTAIMVALYCQNSQGRWVPCREPQLDSEGKLAAMTGVFTDGTRFRMQPESSEDKRKTKEWVDALHKKYLEKK